MSAESKPSPFAWLRKIDDAVYAVEQTIVTSFLGAMTFMVFLDVVSRRLDARDSKIGRLLGRLGGVEDEGTRAFLDGTVAPILGAVIGLWILYFGFSTAERKTLEAAAEAKGAEAKGTEAKGEGAAPGGSTKRPLVLTVLSAAGLGLLGWLMVLPEFDSKYFYLLLYGLLGGGFVVALLKSKGPGWKNRLLGFVVATPIFAWFVLTYFPEGYGWSKEVSLMMLLWVGFLGASICAHEGKHIRMEALTKLVPPHLTRWTSALGYLLTAVYCALITVLGYRYTFGTMGAYELGGLLEQTGIPDWIQIIAVPVAFGLTTVRYVGAAVSAVLGGSYGRAISEEEELQKEMDAAAAAAEVTR